jgi:hypothetical protein
MPRIFRIEALLTEPGRAPDVLPFGRAIGDARGCLSRFGWHLQVRRQEIS